MAAGELSDDELVGLYRALLLPRAIEDKMLALLRRGQLSKWFSGIGQEAISVGLVAALRPDDWILPVHRNLAVFTGRGLDLGVLFRQLLGREGGVTGGRDRTFHFGTLDHHVVGMISHLGAMAPVADGLALAARLRGEDRVAAVLVGDGATSEGDVHEAMNLAAVWKLGVLFVVENNHWGLSTPVSEQYACAHLVDRAAGYGMAGEIVDGNDVVAVRDAVARAAAGPRGPRPHAAGVQDVPDAGPRGGDRQRLRARRAARGLGGPGPDRPHGGPPRRPGRAGPAERAELAAEVRAEVDALVADAADRPRAHHRAGRGGGAAYAPPDPIRRAAVTPSSRPGTPPRPATSTR